MKKFLPYFAVFILLIVGVCYFVYEYSPSTLEKKESEFAVKKIDDVTKVRLTDVQGDVVVLTKKDKKWIVDGKYEASEAALQLLFTAIQKVETNYRSPVNSEKNIRNDMTKVCNKCEIFLNNENKPYKVYYVGGPTADGKGTYMVMDHDGQMASHSYVTHIPGINAYLTGRYYPKEERWRSVWLFRDNDQTIQSLKVTYNREMQKSFEINKVGKDSFVIANSERQVSDQPKQKFIHQYLGFYNALSLEAFKNNDTLARDTAVNTAEPFCTINMKRVDGTETTVIIYYIPVNDQTRVQFDDSGKKLLYDIEHYYLLFNDKKDMALIQYYVWGKVLHSYQDFFVKPGEVKTP